MDIGIVKRVSGRVPAVQPEVSIWSPRSLSGLNRAQQCGPGGPGEMLTGAAAPVCTGRLKALCPAAQPCVVSKTT